MSEHRYLDEEVSYQAARRELARLDEADALRRPRLGALAVEVEQMVSERRIEPWIALAILDAGLPPRFATVGFDHHEMRAIEAAMAAGRLRRAAAGGERAVYGDAVRGAVAQARDLLGGKGAPGPKQMEWVIGALDGGDPLEQVGADREDLVAIATDRSRPLKAMMASRPGLAEEFRAIHEACGRDPFCRGRQLAAMLVAWHDQGGES